MSSREQESLGAGGSQSFCSSRVHLFPAGCSASMQKAGSWPDGLIPQCSFLLCCVSTVQLVWKRKSVKWPVCASMVLDGPMSCILGDILRGPLGSGSECCPRALGQAGQKPQWELCQKSHACLQCRLPGLCCSGPLCSQCSRLTRSGGVFCHAAIPACSGTDLCHP